MIHFRGCPTQTVSENGIDRYWATLCSTSAAPKRGEITTELHKVTCNDCRKVLRLPLLKFDDDSDRRHP